MRKLSDSARLRYGTQLGKKPRPRVLYVEDEKDNYDVLAYRLAQRYKILWAQTDREAVELLKAQGEGLYAILMDIQLMGSALDGIQLTRAIRNIPAPAEPAASSPSNAEEAAAPIVSAEASADATGADSAPARIPHVVPADVPCLPDVPIIFLTGYISRYSREELANAGGNALLGKPVDFYELVEALHELGRARQKRAEGPESESDPNI